MTKQTQARRAEKVFRDIYFETFTHSLMSRYVLQSLYNLARGAADLAGDAAEFGVYKGGSARLIAKALPEKTLHLFDTFSGTPETEPALDRHLVGDFGDTPIEEVENYLRDLGNIEFHQGFFPDTAWELDKEYCFVHIDPDLYLSVQNSLLYFYPRMVSGGLLVFDDYGWEKCPGVKKALDEFMIGKPESIQKRVGTQVLVKKK